MQLFGSKKGGKHSGGSHYTDNSAASNSYDGAYETVAQYGSVEKVKAKRDKQAKKKKTRTIPTVLILSAPLPLLFFLFLRRFS